MPLIDPMTAAIKPGNKFPEVPWVIFLIVTVNPRYEHSEVCGPGVINAA